VEKFERLSKFVDGAIKLERHDRRSGGAIPIRGNAGDEQASLIGQSCFALGMMKST
jgi:glycerol kinase